MTTDQTPDPHRLLDEVSDSLAGARAALAAAAVPPARARTLLGAHVVAFQLLNLFRDAHQLTPDSVTLYSGSTADGEECPSIGFDFDASANVPWSRAEVVDAAARLDLEETTEEGSRSYREWEGRVDGYAVTFTLYLPGAPEHRLRRFVFRHQGAVLAGLAAAGAVAGLGARRAILALVR